MQGHFEAAGVAPNKYLVELRVADSSVFELGQQITIADVLEKGAKADVSGVTKGKEGRDHHPLAFSIWLAGGGVKRGHVHGATDDFGYHVVDRPVHVHDLQATLLHLLGVDHERLTYRHAGRDVRLTDVSGNVTREIII